MPHEDNKCWCSFIVQHSCVFIKSICTHVYSCVRCTRHGHTPIHYNSLLKPTICNKQVTSSIVLRLQRTKESVVDHSGNPALQVGVRVPCAQAAKLQIDSFTTTHRGNICTIRKSGAHVSVQLQIITISTQRRLSLTNHAPGFC